MSFQELYPKEETRKKFIKTDWSVEEKAFKTNHAAFLDEIACANPQVECIFSDEKIVEEKSEKKEEEKPKLQVTAAKVLKEEVKEISEKNDEKAREDGASFVQYNHASDLKEGSPASDDETSLEQMEDFDDIFDSVPQKKNSPPEPTKSEPTKEVAAVKATATVVVAPPVPPTPVVVVDPFEEKTTTENWETPSGSLKNETDKAIPVPPQVSPEIDEVSFGKIQKIIDAILEGVPTSKIKEFENKLPEYAVRLELDHHRKKPEIITDCMTKIQDCRDSINAPLIEISGMLSALEDAEKYIVGVASEVCAAGKTQRAREAAVLLRTSDFFITLSKVKRLYDAYDKTHKAICSQSDFISRLLAAHQNEVKMKPSDGFQQQQWKDSSESAPPFDGPYKKSTHVERPEARVEPKAHIPPTPKSTAGLDAFKAPDKNEKPQPSTGFVGGDDDGFNF